MSAPTRTEVARLATELTADNLEAAVAGLAAEDVPVYLARLLDAATNIRALTKGLERRLAVDGKVGAHFTIDGTEYGFFGALQKGWKDIPNLVTNLVAAGVSMLYISEAISELRVTDLRVAASALTNVEMRQEMLELIEGARFPKGARGAPYFHLVDNQAITPRGGGRRTVPSVGSSAEAEVATAYTAPEIESSR